MGSFPNLTAGRILSSLFVSPANAAVGTPSLYINSVNSPAGIHSGASTVTLYVGLLSGDFVNNTSSGALAAALTDAVIVSAGATSPTASGGSGPPHNIREYTVLGNGMQRVSAQFALSNGGDGSTQATITGPTQAISFAANASTGASNTQTITSVIGFFISTLLTPVAGSAPNIIAYGNLSSSRSINTGDNPTFAANAITITLD